MRILKNYDGARLYQKTNRSGTRTFISLKESGLLRRLLLKEEDAETVEWLRNSGNVAFKGCVTGLLELSRAQGSEHYYEVKYE